MYCAFCGKEIRDDAVFCSQCGRNQATGDMKPGVTPEGSGFQNLFRNKKSVISIIAAVMAIVLISVCINAFKTPSIVGVWMDGTDRITFTSDGQFQWDATYGTYTIEGDKTLVMSTGEYSYLNGGWSLEYGSQAKENEDYWYISGNTLYLFGDEYTRN